MRLLVTGRTGQIARSLAERAPQHDVDVVLLGRPDIDLEQPETLGAAIAAHKPDIIVSAAAYTAVDKAETERDLAMAINAKAPGAIGAIAAELDVPVIHLSTDYVFPGDKASPYVETDPTGPNSVYGLSKLEGERALIAATPNHLILRVAWLYSPFGANFVKTMLRLAGDRDEISVVADQHGNPTSTLDVADAILRASSQLGTGDAAKRGVFHLVAEGEANWAEFATEIFKCSERHGGPSAKVIPITSAGYKTAAQRPANSRLATDKFQQAFDTRLPHWRQSLDQVVHRLIDAEKKD